jgi:hypothetical protein
MSLEKPREKCVKWPTARLDGGTIFHDDLNGKEQIIEKNSERMFVASDSVAVEACMIDNSGATLGNNTKE